MKLDGQSMHASYPSLMKARRPLAYTLVRGCATLLVLGLAALAAVYAANSAGLSALLAGHNAAAHPFVTDEVLRQPWQDDYAFLVKTGSITAQTRVPMQLLTFLSSIKNFVLVGAEIDAVGKHPVVDVATPVVEHLEKFHASLKAAKAGTVEVKPANTSLRHSRRLRWKSDTASKGYVLDRYKNIPGWAKLYELFPHAKWYISIDDDTYWIMETFRDFMIRFDPNVPLLAGNTFSFVASINQHTGDTFERGPMPHGGEGMIFSRASMKAVNDSMKACIEKVIEGTYMYGDVQTALCAREAGVPYNDTAIEYGTYMMNDPMGLPDRERMDELAGAAAAWPQRDPCVKPFAIHHLKPQHMQAIYDVEQAASGKQPTWASLWWRLRRFETQQPETHFNLDGVYTEGLDLQPVEAVAAKENCQQRCVDTPRCMQWTWRNSSGMCHMKGQFAQAIASEAKDEFYSGADLTKYHCRHPVAV